MSGASAVGVPVETVGASAAAVAALGVVGTVRAAHTLVAGPERSVVGARLAVVSLRVLIRQVLGASTSVGSLIPDVRGLAGNALTGVGVEVRVDSIAETFALGGIEGEARRAALTFVGVVVPMGVDGAALALFGSGVPEVRFVT